ncbi:MAG: Bacteriophage protein [Polaromonas sp.]|nr:Bacteriophage protein [Polaromonas sp.]
MTTVSLSPVERARKNVQVVLQALASTGQVELARAMAVHESTISRMKDGGIDTFGTALAHLGLKVVPTGVECYDPEYVNALRTLAGVGIGRDGPRLDWSDVK